MDFTPFPRFSSEKLSIWFAQVEAAFTLNGIMTDAEKYDYVITNIPIEYTTVIEDILLDPPPNDRYEHLKYEFIKRMSISQMKKEQFGNSKPSEYFHRLKKLANQRVSNEMILNIWLNNLPKKVREIVSLETSGHVETLCEMADKVMALLTPTPPVQLEKEFTEDQSILAHRVILNRISELAKQVHIIQMMIDGEHDEQAPSGQQCMAPTSNDSKGDAFKVFRMSSNESPKVMCWYHTIFGDKAVACVAPCQFKFSPTEYYLRK